VISPTVRSSANIVRVSRGNPDKSHAYHSCSKMMLKMLLCVHGTTFINWFPPGEDSITASSVNKYSGLSEIVHSGRSAGALRPIVHIHNRTSHRPTITENCFENCPLHSAHQPHQSDPISRCNFFLFGNLKTKFKGEHGPCSHSTVGKRTVGRKIGEILKTSYK
jgi:hypothetical protein